MVCMHYFVDEAGHQPLSEEDKVKLSEEKFRLGVCIICGTSICADNYIYSGEEYEGKKLLFRSQLQKYIDSCFVSN